jgi:hypothetical protein
VIKVGITDIWDWVRCSARDYDKVNDFSSSDRIECFVWGGVSGS